MIDVSLLIDNGMVVWPGDPAVRLESVSRVDTAGVAVSRMTLSSHCGTHIDAPAHFLADGAGIDLVPLERLIGPCLVLDCRHAGGPIERAELEGRIESHTRVLLKTGARLSQGPFDTAYRSLSEDAAHYLVNWGVELVGIDTLSIEAFHSTEYPVHKALLRAGVVIVEGLDLTSAPAAAYRLIALPLRLHGLDGSPARVVLEPL